MKKLFFFFSSRRRHTRLRRDWSSDVCSSDLSAVLIVVAYTVYLSAQYTAGGIIFQALFRWPFFAGVLVVAVMTLLYTWMGGMRSSVYTDFVQALVMVLAFCVAVPLLLYRVGGFDVMGRLLTGLRSEEHTSELQSRRNLVCRLLLEKKNNVIV